MDDTPKKPGMDTVATRNQTFIAVCCVCGLARESGDPSEARSESWTAFDEYLTRNALHGTDYRLTHGYCPVCVRQYVPARKKSLPVEGPGAPTGAGHHHRAPSNGSTGTALEPR